MSPLNCAPAAPSGAAPAVIEATGLTDSQIAQLRADHAAAAEAVSAPDVTADLTESAADTARHLGLDPHDPRVSAVLLQLATRSYCHGVMDGLDLAREQADAPFLVPMLARRP